VQVCLRFLTMVDSYNNFHHCHAKSVAWTNRVISPGFIMWATVLRLFGQFRWSSCNKLALSSDIRIFFRTLQVSQTLQLQLRSIGNASCLQWAAQKAQKNRVRATDRASKYFPWLEWSSHVSVVHWRCASEGKCVAQGCSRMCIEVTLCVFVW
jgi:hypothetical protein